MTCTIIRYRKQRSWKNLWIPLWHELLSIAHFRGLVEEPWSLEWSDREQHFHHENHADFQSALSVVGDKLNYASFFAMEFDLIVADGVFYKRIQHKGTIPSTEYENTRKFIVDAIMGQLKEIYNDTTN